MGYGRGNLGTAMHTIPRHPRIFRCWLTEEQIQTQTAVSRYIRVQKLQGTYKAQKKQQDALNRQLAKDLHLPWGSHTWTGDELDRLELVRRSCRLSKDIIAKLYNGKRFPLNAELPDTAKLSCFRRAEWVSDWTLEFGEIWMGIMAGPIFCSITVNIDMLLECKDRRAIYLFIKRQLRNGELVPSFDGFRYVQENGGYAYGLKDESINAILKLPDDEKADYIAGLISGLTQQFEREVRSRRIHTRQVLGNSDGKIFTEPADVLKFYYGHDVPWVISEFRKIQMTDEEIVKRLKSEYAYYKYVDYHFRPQDFHYEW